MSAATEHRPMPTTASTLGGMLAAACALRGERPFLVDETWSLDGPGTLEETGRLAGALQALGVAPGSHVCFLARPSVTHTLAWFAAVRCGAVATSLHLMETQDRLAEAVGWLEADLLLCDGEFAALAHQIADAAGRGTKVLVLDAVPGDGSEALLDRRTDPLAPLDQGAPDDPVAVILSSGSTGRPKGIVHSHRTVLASCAAGPQVYPGVNDDDSVLVVIGTSFGGWANVVPPFVASGCRLVFRRRFDPTGFLEVLATERITIAPLVPTMWRMVLAARTGAEDLSALRLAFMSGEPPERTLLQSVQSAFAPRVVASYLSTEGACGCGIGTDTDDLPEGERPEGRPIDSAKVRIVSAEGSSEADLEPGEVGEILLSGPSLATRYWKDDGLTAKRLQGGWWRTGDTGYLTEDGRLGVVGRTDHLINSGGIKVQAEEIEAALMRHPAVRQAAVAGVADPLWGTRIEAWIVPVEEPVGEEEILGWCRDNALLPGPKLPKRIHFTEALPTGPTGKLYRRALTEGGSS